MRKRDREANNFLLGVILAVIRRRRVFLFFYLIKTSFSNEQRACKPLQKITKVFSGHKTRRISGNTTGGEWLQTGRSVQQETSGYFHSVETGPVCASLSPGKKREQKGLVLKPGGKSLSNSNYFCPFGSFLYSLYRAEKNPLENNTSQGQRCCAVPTAAISARPHISNG